MSSSEFYQSGYINKSMIHKQSNYVLGTQSSKYFNFIVRRSALKTLPRKQGNNERGSVAKLEK